MAGQPGSVVTREVKYILHPGECRGRYVSGIELAGLYQVDLADCRLADGRQFPTSIHLWPKENGDYSTLEGKGQESAATTGPAVTERRVPASATPGATEFQRNWAEGRPGLKQMENNP